jgi:hypothetical protein
MGIDIAIMARVTVHIGYDQRLAFAKHPSGNPLRGRKTDLVQPQRLPSTGVVGDFEVQLLALFIEQDDGYALDVEERDGTFDVESNEMVEVVDGEERLDEGPLLEAWHRLEGVSWRGVVAPACAAWAKACRARSTAGRSCGWARAVCRSR